MTSFLFWNVMGKDLRPLIAEAVRIHDVDILMLAESSVSDKELAASLISITGQPFEAISDARDKVRVFSRLPKNLWIRRQTDHLSARMVIWSLNIGPGILVAVTHFLSKKNVNEGEQSMLAVELAKEISRVEDAVGYQRTVRVGDLNMNPFDAGVTGAQSLHAVMTKRLAARMERQVQGSAYRFFYNPMWGLFGDRTDGPPGTFYKRSPGVIELFWHMLDQVLLRPTLMDSLAELRVLDSIGNAPLLTEGAAIPNVSIASDHLPIFFRLELE
ncbi:MAG: endonuclease/exonuclease/phosphatase family protein [Gemmataceae bacterium]|nr:endonuclease/exonuclease/phosphatase family protein [Gemmataceae bacterium]